MQRVKIKNPRIYPIRTSANAWTIRHYSRHKCSEECCLSVIEDDFEIAVVPNPFYVNGKCPYDSRLHRTIVKLCDFDINNPMTVDGPILSGESIVIPDTKIQIQIDFPLKKAIKFFLNSSNSWGFSHIEVISLLANIYKKIYEEEEKTCTEKTYNIIQPCDCIFVQNTEKLESSRRKISTDNFSLCSICLEKGSMEIAETICKHIFHTKCIDKWLSENKRCPLCRENLMKCELCGGTEKKKSEFKGKIVPRDIRGIFDVRNETDGKFGIHSYDFEDLHVDYFFYNNISKILYPKITC